ncbi:hypothetical protein EXIGLDRAFT_772971 [Exidia glandulosa HHB12029]|uniref:Uncharacterized protein n=1 Tax=Exidia glandulosa HHB12029 TaxID=1314781 RepID=A0A165F1J7_EXIGL|nr:hypothetical protein EXIGLDRAFT_772971 [Exidia glandulosa HHB12029]
MDNCRFPDELIKEMLKLSLLVPDELFADTGSVSPFATTISSASDLLLVCKRWMRVGTPALYETVIIRSTAQAQALNIALTRNPAFGRFGKKLRLEGVYSGYITSRIIVSMTSVTDFCFTLSVYSEDKLAGLTKALGTFGLRRIVLTLNNSRRRNVQNRALVKKLIAYVKASKKLEYFSFPDVGCHALYTDFDSARDLDSALADCPSLHTVEAQLGLSGRFPRRHAVVAYLQTKLDRKFILYIWGSYGGNNTIRGPADDASFLKDFPASLVPRLILRNSNGSSITHESSTRTAASNPFFIPMFNSSSQTRTKIWSRIISYAAANPVSETVYWHWLDRPGSTWFDHNRFHIQTAASLLHVSREFYKALIPTLFRHLTIYDISAFRTCERLLKSFDTVSLGPLVETLALSWPEDSMDTQPDDSTASSELLSHVVNVESFLSQLTNVRAAHLGRIRPATYAHLSSISSSLRTLHMHELWGATNSGWKTPISLDVFAKFDALRELQVDQKNVKFVVGSNTDVFPSLEVLKIFRVHNSFFTSLEKTSLPNLKRFDIFVDFKKAETFLKERGTTLTTLVTTTGFDQATLNSMPSLETLELRRDVQPAALSNLKHAKLERLSLRWETYGKNPLDRYRLITSMLSAENFPALREVIVDNRYEIWPNTEREIMKSPWPEMAITLAEKNIALLDRAGRSWRPRLQLQ